MAVINRRKRSKKQNREAYQQSIPAIRARAKRRLKEMEDNPQPLKEYSLADLSPETLAKMGIELPEGDQPVNS